MYKVGEFRKRLKEAMEKADKGESVVIDCYGKKYVFALYNREASKKEDVVITYGCGCVKTDKILCSKHGRY